MQILSNVSVQCGTFLIYLKYIQASTVPQVIIDGDLTRMWYLQDQKFNFPKAYTSVHILR